MTKVERIKAALQTKEVDRVPYSVWLHYPHLDQDSRSLAEHQVSEARKYEYDFIKLMPFGLYSTQDWGNKIDFFCTPHKPPVNKTDGFLIKNPGDWMNLTELEPENGTYGKVLQVAQWTEKLCGGEIPYIMTLFSPMTTALKMAGSQRLSEDLRSNPDKVHAALQVITATTIKFARANINAGVSGFFFATQNALKNEITESEFEEFCMRYDLEIFNSYKDDTFFNPYHIHGDNTYFEKIVKELPFNCLSWHDRWSTPNFAEARKMTDKCFLGGINEKDTLVSGTPEQVVTHIIEARRAVSDRGVIIGPGCVASTHTPDMNFAAVQKAMKKPLR